MKPRFRYNHELKGWFRSSGWWRHFLPRRLYQVGAGNYIQKYALDRSAGYRVWAYIGEFCYAGIEVYVPDMT